MTKSMKALSNTIYTAANISCPYKSASFHQRFKGLRREMFVLEPCAQGRWVAARVRGKYASTYDCTAGRDARIGCTGRA